MGECNYYLKARFPTEAEAREAMPRLTALLVEGEQAYNFWQASRRCEWQRPADQRHGQESRQQAAQFWAEFRERFPLVCQYLGELDGIDDWDNGLAGQLGQLVDPVRQRKFQPKSSLERKKDMLFLQLNGIWHCSEMRRLENYCEDELGAVAAGSVSEEEFDPAEFEDPNFDPFTFIRV